MSNKLNKTCALCGKPYQCCMESQRLKTWRINFCSPECFSAYLEACEKKKINSYADVNENKKHLFDEVEANEVEANTSESDIEVDGAKEKDPHIDQDEEPVKRTRRKAKE